LAVGALVFAITFGAFRIVSLSSMLAAISYGLFYLTPYSPHSTSHALFSVAVPLLIVVQHRSNVKRLLRGEEPRFTSKSESA
jgi:glycerol-3-phosphate acyltransferase PlsY